MNSTCCRKRRTPRWPALLLLLLAALTTGCGTTWQRYQQSQANPANWVRAMLPPDGESFYNEKSHEIERSLNHSSRSQALQ